MHLAINSEVHFHMYVRCCNLQKMQLAINCEVHFFSSLRFIQSADLFYFTKTFSPLMMYSPGASDSRLSPAETGCKRPRPLRS